MVNPSLETMTQKPRVTQGVGPVAMRDKGAGGGRARGPAAGNLGQGAGRRRPRAPRPRAVR